MIEQTNETLNKLLEFFDTVDTNGFSNLDKVHLHQKILRRVESTDKNSSVEAVERIENDSDIPNGIIMDGDRIIGLGIHIYNEDVYPLKSFEINLRDCDLIGCLDISDCEDMVFLDLYHNRISEIRTKNMPAMRIFGVQDNALEELDVSEMPNCQGIDAGMNKIRELDVSHNSELVELYINDNDFDSIDLSHNHKLKYFYCHNNHISELDTRENPLLRHLNATGNPMRRIVTLAPQRKAPLPLELYAGEGGYVGLKFNPIYNAQWKETGEWEQCYYAYTQDGYRFEGWYDENGDLVSTDETWIDDYGSSRILNARWRQE